MRRPLQSRAWLALTACWGALALFALAGGSAHARPAPQPVTVMSYNIFQGTELSNSFKATSFSQLQTGAAKDYQNVVRSKIPARAGALAAEIGRNSPAVVGLLEAVLWRTQTPPGPAPFAIPGTATHVSYDFVKLLVRALRARGFDYRAVAITNNSDVQVTGMFPSGNKMDVRITDRVAIIARSDVHISNVQEHNYVAHQTVTLAGAPIALKDGWASVDARVGGRKFRFVTTHLGGFNTSDAASVRAAEASELVSGPLNTTLPKVLTCDCNAKTDTAAYSELIAAGLRDLWLKVHPGRPGLTCCHRNSPSNPEVDVADPHPHQGIVERIDYIFDSVPFRQQGESRIGLNPADRTNTHPPLWPSDHLGLVGQLSLP